MAEARSGTPTLEIRDLNVNYGQSKALQGVDLTLGSGVLSVVGRNGMGKTTLCKAIMGLVPVASGSIAFNGQNLSGLASSDIARLGIGYVPQGRLAVEIAHRGRTPSAGRHERRNLDA